MPEQSSGLNLLSLADLPPVEQAILKLLLRRGSITEAELREALVEKHFSDAEIAETLDRLVQSRSLKRSRQNGKVVYSVLLTRRTTSQLSEVNLNRRSNPPTLISLMRALDSLEEPETAEAVEQPPKTGSFFFVLIAMGVINAFVLGVLDVVAISGFVTDLGTKSLPWLWSVEMLIGLLISGSYLRIIDRLPRARMMKFVLGALLLSYAIIFGLIALGVSMRLLYPLVYLIYSQQIVLFPMAFWNLSSTYYSIVESRRIFPALASGELIGGLVGYSIFSLPDLTGIKFLQQFGADNPQLLVGVSCGLLLTSLLLSLIFLRTSTEKAQKPAEEKGGFLQDVRDAYWTIRSIPLFRYLFLTMGLEWFVFTILWFQFYTALDQVSSGLDNFSVYYSIFEVALLLFPMILQWLLVARLMNRIAPKNMALGIPAVLMGSLIFSIALPIPIIAIGAVFFPIVLDKAWNTPAFQTLQNLIPEERRGRVGALLSNYPYALGTIAGGLVLLAVIAVGNLFAWSEFVIREAALGLALLAALGSVASALRFRSTYEESMLSWRLKRRQRTDLLDKII
jgi:AAA family ATP:ADP antiporter